MRDPMSKGRLPSGSVLYTARVNLALPLQQFKGSVECVVFVQNSE